MKKLLLVLVLAGVLFGDCLDEVQKHNNIATKYSNAVGKAKLNYSLDSIAIYYKAREVCYRDLRNTNILKDKILYARLLVGMEKIQELIVGKLDTNTY